MEEFSGTDDILTEREPGGPLHCRATCRIQQPLSSVGPLPSLGEYLDENPGTAAGNMWIEPELVLGRSSRERLGCPIQTPVALLDRIGCKRARRESTATR